MDQLFVFIALFYVLGMMACAGGKRIGLFDVVNTPEQPADIRNITEQRWPHVCDQCHWHQNVLYRPMKDGVYGWVCVFCLGRNVKGE